MLSFATIRIGKGSPVPCSRCCRREPEVLRPASEILGEIGSLSPSPDSPIHGISFGGAEPFHHPDLADLLQAARSKTGRIRLETDATALASPGAAEDAIETGVRHLQFRLLAPDLESASNGGEGLERTLLGVSAFADAAGRAHAAVHLTARLHVCSHVLEYLPDLVALSAEAGARAVYLGVEDPALDLASAVPWLEAACDSGVVNRTWVQVEGVPFCFAKGWELHLAAVYDLGAAARATCPSCALASRCPGTPSGSPPHVTRACRPPADAAVLADALSRTSTPPSATAITGRAADA